MTEHLFSAQQHPDWHNGWYQPAQRIVSPNYDERPPETALELVIVHSISLPPGEFGGAGVAQLFTNQLDPTEHPYYAQIAGLKVSAHFYIQRHGALIQFVPVTARAWHAGLSEWQGRERCNDFSIGIELEGDDVTPFTAAQYQTLQVLLQSLQAAWPIKAVTSHAQVAPGRKTDPGPCFNWATVQAVCAGLQVMP